MLEFFDVVKVTHDFDWYVVVGVGNGVYPSFDFTCNGFFEVFESGNDFVVDFVVHDLMYSVGIKYACDSPIES